MKLHDVTIVIGLAIAIGLATAARAQTLDELSDRLDPPPGTEKEYLSIVRQMEEIKLGQRYEFCQQNDISKDDCIKRIALLWDAEDHWRTLFLMSISFLHEQEGGAEAHDARLLQCNELHPDFITETECRAELNEYLTGVVNERAPGATFFDADGGVIHQAPENNQ